VQAVRALITGGRGFVGTWLSEALVERGADVVLVDRETDVADPEAIGPRVAAAEPDVIFHLAALSHVGDSWASPSAVLRVNVLGTAEVLAAARALPRPPVVLVVSSAEVYGIVRPEDLPLREDAPVIPSSPYAASKAAAEQVALQAWRGFGQHVVVVRPFNHIGPGQAPTFAVSALARRIVQAGRTGATELSVGTMSTRRDFTDVRDVVRAYLSVIEHAPPGSVLNICSGSDTRIEDVANRLLELSGSDLQLRTDPSLVRPVDVPVLRGSYEALRELTGWQPEIPLDRSLRDVLAYWESEEG
jgi:GDP-4-dehydro-6-deoxy-D-mannose reductase